MDSDKIYTQEQWDENEKGWQNRRKTWQQACQIQANEFKKKVEQLKKEFNEVLDDKALQLDEFGRGMRAGITLAKGKLVEVFE